MAIPNYPFALWDVLARVQSRMTPAARLHTEHGEVLRWQMGGDPLLAQPMNEFMTYLSDSFRDMEVRDVPLRPKQSCDRYPDIKPYVDNQFKGSNASMIAEGAPFNQLDIMAINAYPDTDDERSRFWKTVKGLNVGVLVNLCSVSDKTETHKCPHYDSKENPCPEWERFVEEGGKYITFEDWPDMDAIAPDTKEFEKFAKILSDLVHLPYEGPDSKRILIHCSAGVGRTGVICAALLMIRALHSQPALYQAWVRSYLYRFQLTVETIRHLRTKRPFMVQRVEQAFMILALVDDYIATATDRAPVVAPKYGILCDDPEQEVDMKEVPYGSAHLVRSEKEWTKALFDFVDDQSDRQAYFYLWKPSTGQYLRISRQLRTKSALLEEVPSEVFAASMQDQPISHAWHQCLSDVVESGKRLYNVPLNV
jgi:protein tyrosine phosphatase